MIWQGQEMLETNLFSDVRSLDWARTNTFSHITRFYRDLIHHRRNLEGVSGGLSGSGCGILLINNSDKVIGYRRYDESKPGEDVVIYANLRNQVYTNYTVPFPSAGSWYVHMNTDSTKYGPDYDDVGSVQILASGTPPTAPITMGPYSALMFSKIPVTGVFLERLDVADVPYGNGDGILDPGENLFASVVLSNKSPVAEFNVIARMTALAEGVQVTQPMVIFPEIPPGAVVTGDTRFVFQIAHDWTCGQPLELILGVEYSGGDNITPWSLPVGLEVVSGIATGTFLSADVPKAIPDNQTTYSDLTISGSGFTSVEKATAWVRINHTWNDDMVIALQHPDGTEVILANRRGGSGDNYGTGACGPGVVYTVFDDEAAIAIASGSPPFAGTFRPDGNLASLHGKSVDGIWRLRVTDVFPADPGTLLCWGIELTALEAIHTCNSFLDTNPDSDNDGIPDWWELIYFGGITNAVAGIDADGDGYSNWQEYLAGTDPNNAASFLRVLTEPLEEGEVAIRWNSVQGRMYRLWRTDDLNSEFVPVQSNIPATPVLNTYYDNVLTDTPWFYKVELETE